MIPIKYWSVNPNDIRPGTYTAESAQEIAQLFDYDAYLAGDNWVMGTSAIGPFVSIPNNFWYRIERITKNELK